MVADVIECAREHDISLPGSMMDMHEAMAEYAFGLLWPSQVPSAERAELARRVQQLHGRDDLLHIATGGNEGTEPDFVSWPPHSGAASWAGTYFMRSGWDADATILRTRYGPLRYVSPTRGSGSMGEVSVFAHGMMLIPFISRSVYRGEFVDYGNAAFHGDGRSRNTIAVDGLGQSRYGRSRFADAPQQNPWMTCPVLDYLRGEYQFDPAQHDGAHIVHERSILFARPDYYLVIDRLRADDGAAHDYRMKYQLSHRLGVQADESRVTATCDAAGIIVEPLRSHVALEIIEGQKEPFYEGWDDAGGFKPAPALIYGWREAGTGCMETVLRPLAASEAGDEFHAAAERHDDGAVVVTVTGHRPDTTDCILIAGDDGRCEGAGCALEGRLGFVRITDDDVVGAGLVEGRSLATDTALLGFEEPQSGWAQRAPDGQWRRGAEPLLPTR